MKDRSRPPRLDEIAGDGVRLGGRLALGLLAAPLLGLALLATRSGSPGGATAGQQEPRVEPPPAPQPDGKAAGAAEAPGEIPGGPARAEIEDALRKLTEATIPGRARPAKAAKRSETATSAEARPKKQERRARPKAASERAPLPLS